MLPSFQLTSLHGNVESANKAMQSEKSALDKSRLSSSWIQMISQYIATRAKNKKNEADAFGGNEMTVTTKLK